METRAETYRKKQELSRKSSPWVYIFCSYNFLLGITVRKWTVINRKELRQTINKIRKIYSKGLPVSEREKGGRKTGDIIRQGKMQHEFLPCVLCVWGMNKAMFYINVHTLNSSVQNRKMFRSLSTQVLLLNNCPQISFTAKVCSVTLQNKHDTCCFSAVSVILPAWNVIFSVAARFRSISHPKSNAYSDESFPCLTTSQFMSYAHCRTTWSTVR
jgi:hypothetical protein